jgi:hypothetical protein
MSTQQNNAIVFRPGPGLRQRLEAVANAQGLSLSQVIRAACENYVANEPGPNIPVMGVVTGGAEDAQLWEAIKKEFQAAKSIFASQVDAEIREAA